MKPFVTLFCGSSDVVESSSAIYAYLFGILILDYAFKSGKQYSSQTAFCQAEIGLYTRIVI